MPEAFDIGKREVSLVISKDNNSIRISKSENDDICFTSETTIQK